MKSDYVIVMLSGKMGSGKTSLMAEITKSAEEGGFTVVPLIFAQVIYNIHDFAQGQLDQRGIKRNLVKDGKLLQLLGTEWGRASIADDIWVQCLKGEIVRNEKYFNSERLQLGKVKPRMYIISDCRFRNEFDGVSEAFKVRLEASKECRKLRCSQWRENDTHLSEIDLDDYAREGKFDCYIDTEKKPLVDCLVDFTEGFTKWFQNELGT